MFPPLRWPRSTRHGMGLTLGPSYPNQPQLKARGCTRTFDTALERPNDWTPKRSKLKQEKRWAKMLG